jgi:hypothetical protein
METRLKDSCLITEHRVSFGLIPNYPVKIPCGRKLEYQQPTPFGKALTDSSHKSVTSPQRELNPQSYSGERQYCSDDNATEIQLSLKVVCRLPCKIPLETMRILFNYYNISDFCFPLEITAEKIDVHVFRETCKRRVQRSNKYL